MTVPYKKLYRNNLEVWKDFIIIPVFIHRDRPYDKNYMWNNFVIYGRAAFSMLETIDEVLLLHGRKIVVAEREINLTSNNANEIFILLVEESRGSAGGRAAGSGSRKVSKIIRFSCANGKCVNSFATDKTELIERLDLPYSAVAMDIKLSRGQEIVVQGIVDQDLVASYISHLQKTK